MCIISKRGWREMGISCWVNKSNLLKGLFWGNGKRSGLKSEEIRTLVTNDEAYLWFVNMLMLVFAIELGLAEIGLILVPKGGVRGCASHSGDVHGGGYTHTSTRQNTTHHIRGLEKSQYGTVPDVPQMRPGQYQTKSSWEAVRLTAGSMTKADQLAHRPTHPLPLFTFSVPSVPLIKWKQTHEKYTFYPNPFRFVIYWQRYI